jgi:hypothetical protein
VHQLLAIDELAPKSPDFFAVIPNYSTIIAPIVGSL